MNRHRDKTGRRKSRAEYRCGTPLERLRPQLSKELAGLLFSASLVFLISPAVTAAGLSEIRESAYINKTEPIYFSGDSFSYNSGTGIITGRGHIEIVQSESRMKGDTIVLSLPENRAEVEGNVAAEYGSDIVEGTKGVFDFKKQEGVLQTARGRSDPWYISADQIERKMTGEYYVNKSSLTTCSLQPPHYRLQAGSVDVKPGERVVARDLKLFAGPVPVFYLPYYSQGLGPPGAPIEFDAGTQSDLGAYAHVGYNLELSKGISVKPNVGLFTLSGIGAGVDGRLNLFDGEGKGRFDTSYIYDLNGNNTDEEGVDHNRGMADLYYRQDITEEWVALLQTEYISDHEFLKTFYFDDYSQREAPRTFLNVSRTGEHSVVSLTARERLVNFVEDVERLPEVRLELLEQELRDTGLLFSAKNDAAYLNHEPGGPESARNFSGARLAYPVRLWKLVGLVPFLEADGTYYSDTPTDDNEYRLSWDAGLVGQSRFHKVYGSPFKEYAAFRHVLIPTVTYQFRPEPDDEPEDLPQFDSIDKIDRENLVEVELRNYLQSKRPDGHVTEMAQYILTADMEFDDGDDKLAVLENEFLIRPITNGEIALKSLNDFRDASRTDLVSAVMRYTVPDSWMASAGVIHEDTIVTPYGTQAMYSLSKAFGPLWRVGIEQRYDFATNGFSYQEFWVWRDLHCWEMLVRLSDRSEATSVMVTFNIKAFPTKRIERRTAIYPLGENNPWPTRW